MLDLVQLRSGVVFVAVLLLAASCSRPPTSDAGAAMQTYLREARAKGFTGQASILADGKVTQSEYHRAVEAGIRCMTDAGVKISSLDVNPLDGLTMDYVVFPNGVAAESHGGRISDRCQTREYLLVQQGFVDTHRPRMDPRIRADLVACLRSRAIRVAGRPQSPDEFARAVNRSDVPRLGECIAAARR